MLARRNWLQRLVALSFGVSVTPELGASGANTEDTPTIAPHSLGAGTYNIRDYGAKGDGKVLDTQALQRAIDQCTADGGGSVLVPEGDFLIGTVELKSNVTLHLAAGAKLTGSADGKQYHSVDAIPLTGDSTLEDGNWALLFAVNATRIVIEGVGTIDGQGMQFHAPARGVKPPSGIGGNQRPYTVLLYRCQNVHIRGVEMVRSAYHCVRIIQSTRVHIDAIRIHNRVNGNNDGFHFISCEHVTLSNSIIESQDDACALFGSCKFITVTNCSFSTRWSVFRFGGGVAENITVSNCLLYQVYGCPIKIHGSPGSRFENLSFSDLILDDVTGPINISLGPSNRPPGPAVPSGPPIARNIAFSNIRGSITTAPRDLPGYPFGSNYRPGEGHSCITLNGVGNAVVENISFHNVHLTFGGGGTASEAARRDLPQIAGEYFMLGPMPAYALYARNAHAITLQDVRFEVSSPELRPAIILDRVSDVAVNGLSVQGSIEAESVLRFIDVKDALLTATRLLTPASVFLQLESEGNEAVRLEGGDMRKAKSALALKRGANERAVTVRS